MSVELRYSNAEHGGRSLQANDEGTNVPHAVEQYLLEDFADLSSDWFWQMDANLMLTYVSDRFTEITGVSESLVIGTSGLKLMCLTDEMTSTQSFRALLCSHQSFRDFRFSILHPDGRDVELSINAKALFDRSGVFSGYRGVGRVVDGRTDSSGPRTDSAAIYRLAGQISNVGFWEWDEVADKCIFCSQELARIHGVSVEEYLQYSTSNAADRRWIHIDDRPRYEQAAERFRRDHEGFEVEYRLVRANQETINVSEIVAPIVDDHGNLIRSFGFVKNISDAKRAEQELLRSQKELERRVAERTADLQRANDELVESQSWLQSATRNARLGYFKWDSVADRGVFCDDELAKILGVPANECMTESLDSYLSRVHHDDVDRVSAAYDDSVKQRLPVDIEYRIVQPNGDIRYVHELSATKTDEHGLVLQTFGTLQDITDRRVIAEELALVEERLHELGANAREVLYVLSADWRQVLYVSNSFEEIWGISCEDIMANPKLWYDALHPEDRDMIVAQIGNKLSGTDSTPDFSDCRVIKPSGEICWLSTRVYPIHDGDGETVRYAGVVEDITERRAAMDALYQSKKMEAVGQLTGGVAHDFNNLLAVILGNSRLMKGCLAPEDEPLLADIIAAGERGAELTQRLLAFSRLQPLQPVMTDVCQLVTGMGELVRRALGTAVSVDISLSDCSTRAFVDPALLENAIFNLVLNARDAMPGGGRLRISVADTDVTDRLRPGMPKSDSGGYLTIVVQDDGAGMEERVLSRALEPFFTTRSYGEGNGLGLSMVYGFAKQSDGDLLIESVPGKGTAVTILLPCFCE